MLCCAPLFSVAYFYVRAFKKCSRASPCSLLHSLIISNCFNFTTPRLAAAYFLFLNLLLTVSCRISVSYIMLGICSLFFSGGGLVAVAAEGAGGSFSAVDRLFKPSIAFNKFKNANFSKKQYSFFYFFCSNQRKFLA